MSWWGGYDTHSIIFAGESDGESLLRIADDKASDVGSQPVIGGQKWKGGGEVDAQFDKEFSHHRNWVRSEHLCGEQCKDNDNYARFYQMHVKYWWPEGDGLGSKEDEIQIIALFR